MNLLVYAIATDHDRHFGAGVLDRGAASGAAG